MKKTIYLKGNVVIADEYGYAYASDMWYQNGTIVVRWVYEDGSDVTSNLKEESSDIIWDIINDIQD